MGGSACVQTVELVCLHLATLLCTPAQYAASVCQR